MTTRLFLYGTLQQSQPNHHVLTNTTNGRAEFIGEARLTQRFPLVVAPPYNTPFLLDKPGVGELVEGEVYDVDDQMLRVLDSFEMVPLVYNRVPTTICLLDQFGVKECECFMFILPKFRDTLLRLQKLKRYIAGKTAVMPKDPPEFTNEAEAIKLAEKYIW